MMVRNNMSRNLPINAFASQRGMGLSPGKGGWELITDALITGTTDQKLAAMDRLRETPSVARTVLRELKALIKSNDDDLREAAYFTLWQLAASGLEIGPAQPTTPPFM